MGSIGLDELSRGGVYDQETIESLNQSEYYDVASNRTNPVLSGEIHDLPGVPNGSCDGSQNAPPPVAIVGMAMRLPGGVNCGKEFWDFLINKRDGLCRVPETRYNIDAFYDPTRLGSVKTKHGYFLRDDPGLVDASFFSLSKFEASKLDPQQRLLLEVVWECMENSGQTGWRGKDIGCFVGSFGEDWLDLSSRDAQDIDRYRVLGIGDFALSNRISYEYDLKGPSITFRTGCSSSMVGLHEACQALFSGECSSALVGGTNLILSPTMTTTMSDNMVLSPSGICKTFDAEADGYGRGEAINVIYIKKLDDALRDNDPIRAIIRSTSTNCDGRTPSITTPGSETQEKLIRNAYSKAQIKDITETAFFECHGTGTVIGDTAETSVVADLFKGRGVYIGAVKPNVGHSEGASGITSVIKAVLALENKTIPPNIHYKNPNPRIPFEAAGLQVPLEQAPWPQDRKERISVNCFGIGGANAHAILESTPSFCRRPRNYDTSTKSTGPRLLVLSAKCASSLQRQIENVQNYIKARPNALPDLAYTLGVRREHLTHRAFLVHREEAEIGSSSFETCRSTKSSLVFVFTGQGAQWPGMGKLLLSVLDSFHDDIRKMDRTLQSLKSPPLWSIEEELSKDTNVTRVNEAEFAQPLCTAVQIGLVNLMARWGVLPASVIGHSSGEIAAAYAAGAIPAETAIIIAYFRGQVAKSLLTHGDKYSGGMAAVGISPEKARSYLMAGVVVACENSPQSVTLSGDKAILDEVLERIQSDEPEAFCRHLRVRVAYHSHHMEGLSEPYKALISPHITFNDSMVPLYSTVTCKVVSDPRQLDAAYWSQNLQSPVLFSGTVKDFLDRNDQKVVFVEIGPHSALSGPLRQIFKICDVKQEPAYIPTLRRGGEQLTDLFTAAGRLHLHGTNIQFQAINGPGKVLTDLPPYPWQHDTKYWAESRVAKDWRLRQFPHHELLGSRLLESSDLEPAWRNLLYVERVPWLWDHKICQEIIFPGAGYIAMAGEAMRQISSSDDYSIRNLFMKTPLILQDSTVAELVTSLRPVKLTDSLDSKWYDFTITSCLDGSWKKHCVGQVRSGAEGVYSTGQTVPFVRQVPSGPWYQALKKRGLDYGPRFRGLRNITADPVNYQATATLSDDHEIHESNYTLHPTVIDQTLQLFSVAATNGIARRMTKSSIPVSIEKIYISEGMSPMSLEVGSSNASSGTFSGDALLTSNDKVVLSLQGGLFFTVDDSDLKDSRVRLVSRLEWKPDIDLVPAADQLPPVQPQKLPMKLVAKLISLYIIETENRIKFANPASPQLSKYQAWTTSQVVRMQEGSQDLVPEGPDWAASDSKTRLQLIENLRSSIEKDWPALMPLLDVPQRVFDICVDVIEGKVNALDILMEEDGLATIYAFSSGWSDWKVFFSLLGHSNPELRVLEIGAGTGAATTTALQGLVSTTGVRTYSTYSFTDISAGFLSSAKEKFKGYQGIDYRVLDISRDPIEQGFEAESYDLVIAANVLHATPSLNKALGNVRTLLAPGGRLLLQELCPVILYVDYVMGILPGWWVGDNDERSDKPYVSPEQWDKELRKTGFTGAEVVAYDNEQPYHFNANILSRAQENDVVKGPVSLLYHSKIGEWGRNLEKQLSKEGYVVKWCTLEEPPVDQDVISLLDLEAPFFDNISEKDYGAFQRYLSLSRTTRTFWVTQAVQMSCEDPRFSLVLGLARTMRHETALDFTTFEVDKFDTAAGISIIKTFKKFQAQRDKHWMDPEYEFALRNGVVHVSRFHWQSLSEQLLSTPEAVTPKVLDIGTYGIIDSLLWVEREPCRLGDDEVEVSIKYVGLNFRDLMVSLGMIGDKSQFGFEGSGIVCRIGPGVENLRVGDRVLVFGMGIFCSQKVLEAQHCLPIPEELSLKDAATMLCVYGTVIHSLINLGNLQKDQSVLIHSACGGVGLAAIEVCRSKGAEIYATVGNQEKVQYLQDTFQIPREHIFDSRSSSFLPGILRQTNGRGVDLVLNSLSGELLHASWQCVAKLGKMIELGKRDFIGHAMLSMDTFACNRAFFGVDLIQLGQTDPEALRRVFIQCIEHYLEGKTRPIRKVTVFQAPQVVQAFRYMQTGHHMGKIVVQLPDDPAELPASRSRQRFSLSPDSSYLLVGGLGGLGRSITTWMVEKGARHFVLLSRSAGKSAGDQSFIKELEAQNCTVFPVAGNVADLGDVKRAVGMSSRPITGVVQMAMVLRDQVFSKMTHEDWKAVLGPKVQGTWNLHNALQAVPLDFFVLFSSVSGLCGNIGQSNYAAANTFLDSFVQYRQSMGLPASVIDLGFMEDIGFVSQNAKLQEMAISKSVQMLQEQDLLDAFQVASSLPRPPGFSQLAIGLGSTKPLSQPGVRPLWVRDARFSLYTKLESPADDDRDISSEDIKKLIREIEINPALLDEKSTEDRVAKELAKLIGSHMSQAEETDESQIANMTIDSLMTIEIRSWYRRNLGLDVTVVEISNAGTVGGLTKTTIKALRLKYQSKPEEGDTSADPTQEFDNLLADAELGKNLSPILGSTPDWHSEPEGRVFLTGATGFVGAFLLASLLNLPHVRSVACLVRTSDVAIGTARIRETFKKYGLQQDVDGKVLVVPGDLSDSTLGLGQERYDQLSEWASVIFHLAAHVNYTQPYSAHRDANVLGTLHMLRFASNKRPKAIHYFSSLSAYGPTGYIGGKTCFTEDEKPAVDVNSLKDHMGYAQSKYVAETIAWSAIEKGLPVSIHRPGVVLGHSISGIGKPDDAINRLMSSCLRIGSYPVPPKLRNQFVPVDYVVSALLRVSFLNQNLGHAYNLLHPDQNATIDMLTTFEIVSRYCSPPLRGIPYRDWVQLFSQTRETPMKVLMPMMQERVSENHPLWDNINNEVTYGTDNLRSALSHWPETLQFPPMSELIKAWLPHWRE